MEPRYSRIEQVEMIGPEGLTTLQNSVAAVLGVGNIGGWVAQHLAMVGIGLILVDKDTVREENLGTQGFTQDVLGLSKVTARAQHLHRLNPSCRIDTLPVHIEHLGLGALREAKVIYCCLDNQRIRTLVNELATHLGIPWVDAAVDGSGKSLFARVAAYDPRSPVSPCYLCPHDRESLGEIMREGRGKSCPVWQWGERATVTAPTLAISALGAAVASMQVLWGLKILLGYGQDITGRELYLDLDRNLLTTQMLKRNPRCVFDHEVFSLTPVGRVGDETTVGETFAMAEERLGASVTLQLHRHSLVTEIRCPRCAAVRQPYRLLEMTTTEEARCACGAIMQPLATGLRDRWRREDAAAFLHKTWTEIGLPPHDVVTAASGSREVHWLFA
jgi:molybdopterin/thiamine biosynthesis adenylyltransferase